MQDKPLTQRSKHQASRYHRGTHSVPVLRSKIDRIDRRLVHILNQRAALALLVGELKREQGYPVVDRHREAELLREVGKLNCGPLSQKGLKDIFRDILRTSRQLQAATRK